MLEVQLPDSSSLKFEKPLSCQEVAAQIGAGLAKAAVAAEVDGTVVGLDHRLPAEGKVQLRIFTKRDPEALDVMRHSCAHVMARAVMRLFPDVKLAFGPTVAGGFYYDFDLEHKLSDDDFPAIEAEMAKIIKLDEPFERVVEPKDKALTVCRDLDQPYKVEHLEGGLDEDAVISFYQQGEFIDLCRGPHVPSPKAIGAFKLLSVAGAYFKGDESRPQLQRLYGTAFFNKEDLKQHLEMVEEAKRRDHRVLGKQLELFTIDPTVGSGLILWLPKGARVRNILENFVRDELERRGYLPVCTPNVGRVELYETSGHFPFYRDAQFVPVFQHGAGQIVDRWLERLEQDKLGPEDEQKLLQAAEVLGFDGKYRPEDTKQARIGVLKAWAGLQERFLLKPMNCPHHVKIYQSKPRSYRDLPLRLAEFGTVYRYEKSGELSGMTRVRGFTQDDAHIFCTEDQVADEFRGCIEMTQYVLAALGLNDYRVRLGFRDPASSKYVGSQEGWDKAEAALQEVCRDLGIDATPEPGEAAFYGPKADYVVTDCIGREWQLGTVQLDYNLPSGERFDLEYIGPDNRPHRPVMIHRAPLGSLERFVGVLIEHFAGAFPLWLAPEQARVLIVSEKSESYGREIETRLRKAGLRVGGDYRSEKLGAKIRDAQLEKIPYMVVVGEKDLAAGTVTVRDRIDGDLGSMTLGAAIERFEQEIADRTVRQTFGSTAGLGDSGAKMEY